MTRQQLDEERIFHVALGISDPELQNEYLDQVSAGDLALRERVEALLQAHEHEQQFLKSNPILASTDESTRVSVAVGQQIGRYKLLQQIGEGGFGIVYMAEQHRPVRRKVALKVIKPGMDTAAVVARFEAERQALAMMDHPNISRVMDGGATESGRPYFVMELVKGVPITDYCDKNLLSTRDRLELFITVCRAVQHAHQKGVIHRDIKPSNILVTLHDGQPVVKVIDFGVAKAINQQLTEKTLFTAYGQMVGTPQYMSPEQAEMSGLDVDTRSDIYSLGVLLYELLTGETPVAAERLRTAGYAEMQRIIQEEEPPKPSTRLSSGGKKLSTIAQHRAESPERLHRLLRGELDWVVMKALEKDRARRYETADALAADVRRFLDDEAVFACPPSSLYQLRKFVRRHRSAALAASVVLLVMIGATLVSATFAYWAIEQRDYATLLLEELRSSRKEQLAAYQEQTLQHAFSGGFAQATLALEKAIALDATTEWELINRAHIAIHSAEYDAARQYLQEARSANSESVACKSLLVISHMFAGFEYDYWTSVGELEELQPISFEDYVFRGFANSVAFPGRAVRDLDAALVKQPGNAIVRVLLGSALQRDAMETTDSNVAVQLARRAADEIARARTFLSGESAFAAAEDIQTTVLLGTLFRQLDRPSEDLLAIETRLRTLLRESENLPYDHLVHLARVFAEEFLHPQDLPASTELFEAYAPITGPVHERAGLSLRETWTHYLKKDLRGCIQSLDRIGDDFPLVSYANIVRAEAAIERGRSIEEIRAEIETICAQNQRRRQGFHINDWALLKMVGSEEAESRLADFRNWLLEWDPDLAAPWLPLVDHLSGTITVSDRELLSKADRNRWYSVFCFLLGIEKLANGERRAAKDLFRKTEAAGFYRMYANWWARAFMTRVDDPEWLPWLPNNGSLSPQ